MTMDNAAFIKANRLPNTPKTLQQVHRVRSAGAYLRARAYRRYLASGRGKAAERRWLAGIEASHHFEWCHVVKLHRAETDIEFTRSSFGGGWASPQTELGETVLAAIFPDECPQVDCDPWPNGWIVEPYEVEVLAEIAAEQGACVREAR